MVEPRPAPKSTPSWISFEPSRSDPPLARSGSSFHGNAEPLYLFVFAQFRTENRFTLFLELL
ncbi:MAG: hypothetical protein E5Y88_17390 [Mesorhizobium sp.]|nr:MAG: hypothetical protein EOS20_09805 [Mesorhizobium sp.]TIL24475.1 MAG: hypothetical protein E5Y88_17390 [Mesorhizobium sp.]